MKKTPPSLLIVKKKLTKERIPILYSRIFSYLCCMDIISLQPDMLVALQGQCRLLGWYAVSGIVTTHGIEQLSATSCARFVAIKRPMREEVYDVDR